MNKISHMLLSAIALTQGAWCFADYVPSAMPQGTPPQISEQTKQLIQRQIQASPILPVVSANAAAPNTVAMPQNLSTFLKNGNSTAGGSADNFDNQHAYHNQIKQYLQTQKR